MLRLIGAIPLPAGTILYLAFAIVCLVFGFLLNLIASVTSWRFLLWVSVPLLAAGALCAVVAVRRAASG
jgi:hypothetical protein